MSSLETRFVVIPHVKCDGAGCDGLLPLEDRKGTKVVICDVCLKIEKELDVMKKIYCPTGHIEYNSQDQLEKLTSRVRDIMRYLVMKKNVRGFNHTLMYLKEK
jgi:Fe-S-cluster-containing hydrogenase component 2